MTAATNLPALHGLTLVDTSRQLTTDTRLSMLQAFKRARIKPLPCRHSTLLRSFARAPPKSPAEISMQKKEERDYLLTLEFQAQQKAMEKRMTDLKEGSLDDEMRDMVESELMEEILMGETLEGMKGVQKPLPRLLKKSTWTKSLSTTEFNDSPTPFAETVLKPTAAHKIHKAIQAGVEKAECETIPPLPNAPKIRRNAAGVQLLSPSLHAQLFPGEPLPHPPSAYIKISLEHLKENGLKPEAAAVLPPIELELPKLQGETIKEHFERLGLGTAEPYLSLSMGLAQARLPDQPSKWVTNRSGWTRYRAGVVEEVEDLGGEQMVVFDVEVLYKISPFAVMAIAATPNAWYSWLSPSIFATDAADGAPSIPKTLIPLGKTTPSNPMIVCGHNVGYDRARIADEYSLRRSSLRFLDTLSLHASTKGITNVQRPAWQVSRNKRAQREEYLEETKGLLQEEGEQVSIDVTANSDESQTTGKWQDLTSLNSLKEVARLHLGIKVDKSIRDVFGDAELKSASYLRDRLESLLQYCADDVLTTHQVLGKTLPLFLKSCPHPVAFSGQLLMGSAILPIDSSWANYLEKAESKYRELEGGVKGVLWELAGSLRRRGQVEGDFWGQQLDWTEKKGRWEEEEEWREQEPAPDPAGEGSKGIKVLAQPSQKLEPPAAPAGPSPKWMVDHLSDPDFKAAAAGVNLFPLLARVSCHGYPLFESTEHRWVFRAPATDKDKILGLGYSAPVELKSKSDVLNLLSRNGDYVFFRIREGKKVTSVLANTQKILWKDGILSSPYPELVQPFIDTKMNGKSQREAAVELCEAMKADGRETVWGQQLDWTETISRKRQSALSTDQKVNQTLETASPAVIRESTTPLVKSKTAWPAGPAWVAEYLSTNQHTEPSKAAMAYGSKLPLLARVSCHGYPVFECKGHRWVFRVPNSEAASAVKLGHGPALELDKPDLPLKRLNDGYSFFKVGKNTPARTLLSPSQEELWYKGVLTSPFMNLVAPFLIKGSSAGAKVDAAMEMYKKMLEDGRDTVWGQQLNWEEIDGVDPNVKTSTVLDPALAAQFGKRMSKRPKQPTINTLWPKWYWDLTAPRGGKVADGELDLSITKSITPLLLRLEWKGYPLFRSREYKWLYRIPKGEASDVDRAEAIRAWNTEADAHLAEDTEALFRKLPHADGSGANVGSPLSKSFQKHVDDGTLTASPPLAGEGEGLATAAAEAIKMNGQCAYWVGARNRILEQIALYGKDIGPIGEGAAADPELGLILPQVVTMGTVTRRAVETTWLTASNAKKNRLGSELKAMIRAPPGYSIVGADVDSEELWIASVMGDAQFGMHGATAIGWMTLEGTKAAGTDLHSKTASILHTSRDNAKVFNYSRIYGAGERHAIQLLRKNDSSLTEEKAQTLAKDLYTATKGKKTKFVGSREEFKSAPGRWHGGSESYLFNALESVAGNHSPQTPALGCGVTEALKKKNLPTDGVFGSDYLPSRINWAVQSSGVDYLHLLIVSMEYLIERYGIQARYMISVHDEVRYLVKDEDKYRAAMALQIANAWTRALFCYRMGMDDLPQGVAFFSAVDIDHVFRKEVDMPCVTPSQDIPISPGESLDIMQLLSKPEAALGSPRDGVEGTWRPELRLLDLPDIQSLSDMNKSSHKEYLLAQANKASPPMRKYLRTLPADRDPVTEKSASQKTNGYRRLPTQERREWQKQPWGLQEDFETVAEALAYEEEEERLRQMG